MSDDIARAIQLLKAAGYRVTKPSTRLKKKDRVGPTFVAKFADGEVTRMSTFTMLERLDYDRGVRLSRAAYENRIRTRLRAQAQEAAKSPDAFGDEAMQRYEEWLAADRASIDVPAIVRAYFEQDGVVLQQYEDDRRAA